MTEPNLKPKTYCPCSNDACEVFGTVTKSGCVRGCSCARCRGRRNRRKGLTSQREARKALGMVPASKFGDSNEETLVDPLGLFRMEAKEGAQVKPVITAWRKVKKQSDANQPDFGGLGRDLIGCFAHDGVRLVVLEENVWRTVVLPALTEVHGA